MWWRSQYRLHWDLHLRLHLQILIYPFSHSLVYSLADSQSFPFLGLDTITLSSILA